jgi:hypothetical protein
MRFPGIGKEFPMYMSHRIGVVEFMNESAFSIG